MQQLGIIPDNFRPQSAASLQCRQFSFDNCSNSPCLNRDNRRIQSSSEQPTSEPIEEPTVPSTRPLEPPTSDPVPPDVPPVADAGEEPTDTSNRTGNLGSGAVSKCF